MGVHSKQKCFQVKLRAKKEGGRSFGGGRISEVGVLSSEYGMKLQLINHLPVLIIIFVMNVLHVLRSYLHHNELTQLEPGTFVNLLKLRVL